MSANYSAAIPVDRNQNVKTGYPPPKVALASTHRENASTSSILLLTHDTTEINVVAIGTPSFMAVAGKWISQANLNASVAATSVITAAGSANFDFIVPGGTTYSFVVPVSTNPQTAGSIQGVNRDQGLFPAVAFKTTFGNGSVLTAEF